MSYTPFTGTVTIIPTAITYTDRSGSIAIGGTQQTLIPASENWRFFIVQNLSADLLWIDIGVNAIQDQPSIKLMPGSDPLKIDSDGTSGLKVSIIGPTTGQKFSCKEGK